MKTRRASAEIGYNGQNITVPMGQYLMELTYSDSSSGEGDTIDLKVQDSAEEGDGDDLFLIECLARARAQGKAQLLSTTEF